MEEAAGLQPHRSKQYFKRPRDIDYEEAARMLFEKKFRFEPPAIGAFVLPESSRFFAVPPWSVKSLQVEKSCLNFHKSQLNDFQIEEWSPHTRKRNPAGEVSWLLRRHINPEFLTQAWTKFYECAFTYDIVPAVARDEARLRSLHLCEAPGAFITALNHYLKLHHPNLNWTWTATTLNPYYEGNSPSSMISDDRFMSRTLQHWSFGCDDTGDLMSWTNSQSIVRRATADGPVMLVTADGSIDCLQRPDSQEEITSPLHYCEVVTALQALGAGGTLVCKLFTMFEHSTVNLLYLLNAVFQEVNIYKPVTSKPGNSEVYAVCLRYVGVDKIEPYIDALKAGFGTKLYDVKSLFPMETIPEAFIDQVWRCSQFFCYMQCNVINSNLESYLQKNYNCPEVRRLRTAVAAKFINYYDVQPITHEQEILLGLMHDDHKVNTNPRHQRGSFTQRQSFDYMSAVEKCQSLEQEFGCSSQQEWMKLRDDTITWQEFYDADFDVKLQFTHGSPLMKLRSSKFIFTPVFNQFRRLIDEGDLGASHLVCTQTSAAEVASKYAIDAERWKILDLPDVNIDDYEPYNRMCLRLILRALSGLQPEGTLFLTSFDILTHTSVGILFILCKVCFRSVGFTDGNGLVLREFVGTSKVELLRDILKECERSEKESKSVVRVLPVMTTNAGEFYNTVICYNNSVYNKKSIHLLSNFRSRIMRCKK